LNVVCELCNNDGGELLFRDAKLRVVAVTGAEAAYRATFPKPIWAHTFSSAGTLSCATIDDSIKWKEAARFALSAR
jgi:hypothetical protein